MLLTLQSFLLKRPRHHQKLWHDELVYSSISEMLLTLESTLSGPPSPHYKLQQDAYVSKTARLLLHCA